MDLENSIRELVEAEGIEFFGIADLAPARAAILEQGGPMLAPYHRALSLGVGLLHSIVDQLAEVPDRLVPAMYRYFCYDLVNERLDRTAGRLSNLLQAHGYAALPVAAAPRVGDPDRLCGVFSSKMAAHLAGLGWIGKSCLLVTPQAGPRVRWASVLTNAPLSATGSPMAPRCGECRVCVDACPAHAFTGAPFRGEEQSEARFRAGECARYLHGRKDTVGERVCGLCVKACPHGRHPLRRDE